MLFLSKEGKVSSIKPLEFKLERELQDFFEENNLRFYSLTLEKVRE